MGYKQNIKHRYFSIASGKILGNCPRFLMQNSPRSRFRIILAAPVLMAFVVATTLLGQSTDNPGGPTGIYTGNITTAGNYDPYTGNQTRVVEDLVVPGCVGAFPLNWATQHNT